jgi:TRAP-type C4-dicarboxylate transport system permease small subunit
MNVTGIKEKLDRMLAWVVIVLMAAITLNVLWQVFTRFIIGDPSSFTDELARFMLIWIGLLGAAYVMGQRGHLAIDLLLTKLPPRPALFVDALILCAILVFAIGVMFIGGVHLVYLTFTLEQISAALNVSLAYVYLALPLSGFLIAFYAGVFLLDVLRVLSGREALFMETRVLE